MDHILIIDDEPTFTKTFETLLGDEGYRVSIASNAMEGLKKVSEDRPDLILLDIGMPGMDGLGFLRELRARDEREGKMMPVLILSNFTDMEKVSEGVELGVRGYVVKIQEDLQSIAERVKKILIDEEIRRREEESSA